MHEQSRIGPTTLELECLKLDCLEISCLIRRIEASALKKYCDDHEKLNEYRLKTLHYLITAIKKDTEKEYGSCGDDHLVTQLLLDLAEMFCPRPNHHSFQLGPIHSLLSDLMKVQGHLVKHQLVPSELSVKVARELRIFSEWARVTKRKLRQAT